MITAELCGRLGNQMFQYAVARIIAEKNGFNFYITKEINGAGQNVSNYFNLDMGIFDGQIKYRYMDNPNQIYDPNFYKVLDFTSISGFFQTDKYFVGYEDKIKEWFKPIETETTKTILKKYPIDEYCYIHFRGGDYKECGDWYLPKKYYDDAIIEIQKINKDLKFVVVTDFIEDAKHFFNDIDIISNDMITDFELLYNSKYCIIPNSSFSWWAAWLSDDKITIAPSRWLNYNKKDSDFWPADIGTKKFIYI